MNIVIFREVVTVKKTICSLLTLCMVLWAGAWLVACMEIPSSPHQSGKATEIAVYVLQKNNEDSTAQKINATEKANLKVHVNPSKFENDLEFFWYIDEDLLETGKTFTIDNPLIDEIPNRVVAKDKEGNSLEKFLDFETNTPPRIGSTLYPEKGAVFILTENQTITFKWYYVDIDNDPVESILHIDEQVYNVGTLTQIVQSGFKPGEHKFFVEVVDSYGDRSVSEERTFTVQSPAEEP